MAKMRHSSSGDVTGFDQEGHKAASGKLKEFGFHGSMGHDQAMDIHDKAIDKANTSLEVARLLQQAHQSGPFQQPNAPPA